MRRNLSLISVLLITVASWTTASAQQLRWGALAGVNINAPESDNTRVGFNVGGKAEYSFGEISQGWLIDAEANFSYIPYGHKVDYAHDQAPDGSLISTKSADFNNNTFFLNIPVTAGYRVALGNSLSINFNLGAFINTGLFGQAKLKYPGMDFDENSFKKGDNGGDMRRVNWGVLGKVGLQLLDRYQLSVSYNQGLMKPGHSIMSNRQRMFNVSVGYMF